MGFQNKNSYLGSEKIQRERIKSESMDRKIWLTNPPTLHKNFYEKENTPTHQNTVQMFATKGL